VLGEAEAASAAVFLLLVGRGDMGGLGTETMLALEERMQCISMKD
jgi:hypothetical protein